MLGVAAGNTRQLFFCCLFFMLVHCSVESISRGEPHSTMNFGIFEIEYTLERAKTKLRSSARADAQTGNTWLQVEQQEPSAGLSSWSN